MDHHDLVVLVEHHVQVEQEGLLCREVQVDRLYLEGQVDRLYLEGQVGLRGLEGQVGLRRLEQRVECVGLY